MGPGHNSRFGIGSQVPEPLQDCVCRAVLMGDQRVTDGSGPV